MVQMANNPKSAVPQVRASGCSPSKECDASYPTRCDSTSFNVLASSLFAILRTASTTIKGMETIRGIYKKIRKEGNLFGFSVCTEIKILLDFPA